jgi:hypothetical protein
VVLAKHIPGNPTILFQYMPRGGGRKTANHLYNTPPAPTVLPYFVFPAASCPMPSSGSPVFSTMSTS